MPHSLAHRAARPEQGLPTRAGASALGRQLARGSAKLHRRSRFGSSDRMNGLDLEGAKPQRLSRAAACATPSRASRDRAAAGHQLTGSSKWAGTGNPTQCLQRAWRSYRWVMHEPGMSHVSSTRRPSRGTKTVLPLLPPLKLCLRDSEGVGSSSAAAELVAGVGGCLCADPSDGANVAPQTERALRRSPPKPPTLLPADAPPGGDRCALRSRCGNGG
jgi:hypothetical protein